ncbi:MAG: (Fe-S)-binding protein [Ardenticatenaceae bacterium]|nr:(Fe-S)-binding protein [Ardenticatenaceae bacterium]HBY92609.1 Fe-S oxidoreductase [Chloroflexota bacterium]
MTAPRRVALFVTCIVDQVYPEIGEATVRLLRRAGCEVDFPMAQTCCGQPFFNSGFRSEATHLAKRFVEIFEDYDAIVAPSGSCVTMVRIEYPHLLHQWPGWEQRALAVAAKTYELSEFLVDVCDWRPAGTHPDGVVTYHDSCHMCRLLGLRTEPRTLLDAAGTQRVEMRESDRCCGFGGSFSVRMPAVSNAMTREKLAQAQAAGATMLVTADPGCLMQLRGVAAADRVPLQPRHLAEVLDDMLEAQG